jgi:hypothetical protein
VLRESTTVYLAVIGTAVRDNVMVMIIAAVILAVTGLVVYYLCKQVWGVVQVWRRMKPTEAQKIIRSAKTKTNLKTSAGAAGAAVGQSQHDDVEYQEETLARLPPQRQSDRARISNALTRLKGRYAAYNKAATDYAIKVKGRAPDDLMDEKVLSAQHDDAKWETRAERERDSVHQGRGDRVYK